jgi:D-xylose transport system substrate-binding protein
MKHSILFSLILTFAIFFSACDQNSKVTIGFLMPDGEGSRWPTDEQYLKEAAAENGVELISRSADTDENLQISQATELLEAGVDVLIVVPANANTAGAIVREAHDYGVPVIAYDRLIKNSDLDYLITFEGAKIAELMVDHALNKVPEGNYVLLWGDPGDVNAISIKNAQNTMLAPYIKKGDINIIYKGFVEDWTQQNAYHLMSKILTFSDQKIDAVLTSYDGLAMGALQAIKEHPEQKVKVLTGQDAELDAVKALVNGDMTLTVYKSIKTIANSAMDLAIKLATDQNVENATSTVNNGRKDVPAILLVPQSVDKSTIRSTVIADGYYTEEQVYED